MTLRLIIIASTLLIVLSLCSLAAMTVFFTNNNNTTTSNLNTRRRQLSQMQLTTSPHHGYGTHFVTVHMGGTTQPQTLALALDSDHTSVISDDSCLSIPLEYFHTCPAQCHYPESSCSSDNKYCQVTVQYSDSAQASGYIGAELTNNEFHLSPLIKFPLSYICQQELFGPVRTPDGILGMSTSPNSFIHQYYNSLFQAKEHRMFSMCFRPFSSYAVGSSAGMVTVGHVDPEQLDSPIVYAANHGRVVTKHDYAVRIRKMYMGVASDLENPLVAFADGTMSVMPLGSDWNTDNNAGNAAHLYQDVDGTHDVVPIHTNSVLTSFPKSLEQAFVATFSRMTQSVEHPNGHSYALPSFRLTKHDYDQLPTLFIQLEAHQMAPDNANSYIADFVPGFAARHDPHYPLDVILAVKPQHYISYHEDTGKAMPTLLFSDTGTQLASNIFQEMEVVLDLTRNKIGFAQRFHCPPGLTVTHTKELICHSDETRRCDDNDGQTTVLHRQPELNCHFPDCPAGSSTTRTGTVAMQEGPLGGELDGQGASVASSTGTTNGPKKGRTTDSNVLIPNQYRGKDTIPYFRQPDYDQQPVPMAEGPLGKSVYAMKFGESAKKADADLAARHSKGFNETTLFSTWTMVGFVIFATSFVCTALCTQKEFFKVAEWLAGFEINNETVGKGMEAKLGPSTYEDEKRAEIAWLKGKSFYSQHPRRPIRKEPNMRGVQTSHQYASMQQQAVYQPPVYSKAGPKQALLTRKYENDYIDDDDDDEATEYLTESSEHGPFMTIHADPHQHARKLSITSTMSGNEYYH